MWQFRLLYLVIEILISLDISHYNCQIVSTRRLEVYPVLFPGATPTLDRNALRHSTKFYAGRLRPGAQPLMSYGSYTRY